MTYGITNTVALNGIAQKMNYNNGQVELKQGDIFNASVIDVSGTSISIAPTEGIGQKVIDFQTNQELNLSINDYVEIEVIKASQEGLELSIRKLEENQKEIAESHNPLSDSVNLDEVKKSIITTNNPLQFSKQLDNHINHAIAQVDTMLESFSDEEISTILNENFDVTKMTIDLLYQVGHSNRVDKKLALVGDEDRAVNVSVNDEKINALINEISHQNVLNAANKEDIQDIVKELINSGIKPEPKNVEKVINFIEKVDKVKQMSSKDIIQFLSSDKESSIAELHKSLYVSGKNVKKDVISEKAYKEIEPEVKKIVESKFQELEVEDIKESLDIAKALVKKGIAIDERAIETIKYIKEPVNLDETIKLATEQIKRKENPDKVTVTSTISTKTVFKPEEVADLTKLVNKVSSEDIKALVLNNRTVSFHELQAQIEEVLDQSVTSGQTEEIIEQIPMEVQETIDKNVENLQIIRYQMTYKAAMSLSIQGLDLKHSSLDVIRERIESFELLHVETSKELNQSTDLEGVKSGDVKIDLNESQTLSKKELAVLEVKKHMALISASSTKSIASIATSQTDSSEITLLSLSKSASVGADRYDELRTMPRTDLGDHIEKAFSNVDEILVDLKLENTSYNQRAVEILGRNEMAITVENIQAVKELDIELQEIFTKLMPEQVKELVDQNINIINEPIDKLADYVRLQESAVHQDIEEQVAKHITTMLKNNELTGEQKDALIGVYRMIHTIESSKGAAVGFLLNNDLEVNLENLFDAAKMISGSNASNHVVDVAINDSFGQLESMNNQTMTIKEQIQSGYFEKEVSLNDLVSKVLSGSANRLTSENSSSNEQSQVNDLQMIKDIITKEEVIEIKDLLTLVNNMQKNELRESLKQNMNPSLNDLKAFDELSENPGALKDLLKEFAQVNVDFEPLRDKLEAKITEFLDQLTPEGQEEFQKGIKEVLSESKDMALKDFFDKQNNNNSDNLIKETPAFSGDQSVHHLSKDIESQLLLQKQLIDNDDYYSVPVMINGEIQHMSMYYFKQENESLEQNDDMSVYFSFTTQHLGTANIRVQLKGEESNVTMYATEDVGNRQLKSYESDFKDLFDDVGLAVSKMKYDTFLLPTPVKPDQKIARANKVSKYSNNLFEKLI